VTTALLRDNCAWVRLADAALPTEPADEIPNRLESGRIAACLPLLLEAGYSALNACKHAQFSPSCDLSPIATSTTPSKNRLSMRTRSSPASAIIAYRPSVY
jgi:hypothetical protein